MKQQIPAEVEFVLLNLPCARSLNAYPFPPSPYDALTDAREWCSVDERGVLMRDDFTTDRWLLENVHGLPVHGSANKRRPDRQ